MGNEKLDRYKELGVFAGGRMVFGLPRPLFVGLCLICGGQGAILSIWAGLLFALVLFPPLYIAHRSDPAAVAVWGDAFRSRVLAVDPAVQRLVPVLFD